MRNIFLVKKTRGISLIEGVLYLVLALSVISGGIVFFQQALLSNNATNTSRTITGISTQTRGLFQSSQNLGPDGQDLTQVIISAGGVASNFIDNNNTPTDGTDDRIVHPFDGNIELYAEDGGAGSTGSQYFVVEIENLGEAECVRLARLSEDGDGPLGVDIVALGILPGTVGSLGTQDSAALASNLAAPTAPTSETNTMVASTMNQAAPGAGIDAAGATLVCAEEDNTVFAVYIAN